MSFHFQWFTLWGWEVGAVGWRSIFRGFFETKFGVNLVLCGHVVARETFGQFILLIALGVFLAVEFFGSLVDFNSQRFVFVVSHVRRG